MTRARQIISGSIYMITRRCSERRYFLAPQPDVNELFGYLLVTKANEHGVELLGAVQMSNHYHLVVHDPCGTLPKFLRDFNAMTARGVNRLRGRSDAFWDARQTAVTELCDADSVMRALVYVACNPVSAGLVGAGDRWNAVRSSPSSYLARPRSFKLPRQFLRSAGRPASVAFQTVVPPTHRHLTPEQFAGALRRRIKARERELRERAQRYGDPSFGEPSRPMHWSDAPQSQPKRANAGIVPRVMAGGGERRRGVLERQRTFRREHAVALARLNAGDYEAVFPGGTWKAVQTLRVRTTPTPLPAWRLA